MIYKSELNVTEKLQQCLEHPGMISSSPYAFTARNVLRPFMACMAFRCLHFFMAFMAFMAAFFFITFIAIMAFMAAFFFITFIAFMAFMAAFFFITFGAAAFIAFIAFAIATRESRRSLVLREADVA